MLDKARYAAECQFALGVLSFYTRLLPPDRDSADLAGRLLYAGLLDEEARALIAAANIAGAASLAATPDLLAQKRAVHEGIADFLVNSLDEALRILKNEVRKGAPVAVCIGAEPAGVEAEMTSRGVEPDLQRSLSSETGHAPVPDDIALVSWGVSSAPARWMPKLDACALECGGGLPESTLRWLRLAPRYLGRLAQSVHVALANKAFADRFFEAAKKLEDGIIPLKLQVSYRGASEEFNAPQWDKDKHVPGS